MPLYSFHCKSCDHDFETLARSDEKPACPACGALEAQKLVSRIAPEGKTKAFLAGKRAQAASEGHFSNYGKSELKGKL